MANCFVNKNITGGVDNIPSSLNESLKQIFPNDVNTASGQSNYYLRVLRGEGDFKSKFGVDWETAAGQEYINKNYPGFLGEQGEPKLYVDKVGRAYFKTPEGNYILNNAVISENERYETVKALMAGYMSDNVLELKPYILSMAKENGKMLNMAIMNINKKEAELLDLFKKPGITAKEKNEIKAKNSFYLQDKIALKKSMSFLMGIVKNDELAEILVHDVKIVLETSKVAYKEDVYERENDDAAATIELGHLRPSNESNPQNSLPTEILQLISTIPKTQLKFSEKGDIAIHEKVASELMPLLTYIHDYSDVFKEVQKVLNNVVAKRISFSPEYLKGLSKSQIKDLKEKYKETSTYEAMIKKLTEYRDASDSHIVSELLLRLEKLVDSQKTEKGKINIKSKFAKAFQKAKSSNVMHTSNPGILESTVRAGDAMININNIDLSDEENRSDLLASELVVRTMMKLSSIRTEKEIDAIDDLKIALMQPNVYAKTKENLGKYLEKKYGLALQEKTVSQLLFHINKNIEGLEKRSKVEQFIYDLDNMTELHYKKSDVIIKGQKKNKNYTIKNLAESYFNLKPFEKETIIENFTSNGGKKTSLGLIAELEYKNSPSSADSSIAVGSRKVWLYSFISKMQKDVILWKNGDVQQLENLKNTGNGMVDFLLGKENGTYNTALSQKRIDKISMKNNMELRNAMDTNPAVFDKLTQEDLILMVYANLYENKKEKYYQREQGGSERIGESQELQDMMDGKETANEFTYLNNSDKTQTLGLKGIMKGESQVEMDAENNIISIGKYNTDRLKEIFYGELNKIQKVNKAINAYNSLKSQEEKLSYAMKNFIPGWHYKTTGKKDYSLSENEITTEEFLGGNYRKFGFMNGFYNSNMEKLNQYIFEKKGIKNVYKNFAEYSKEDFDLEGMIEDYFTEILRTEAKELVELTGFSEREEYSSESESMETMPRKGLFDIQTSVIHEKGEIEAMREAGNMSMNYLFHSLDFFNIFNGEIGMYKQKGNEFNMMDALKRTSAVNADGIYATNHDPFEVAYYLPFGNKKMKVHKGTNPKAIPYFKNSKTIFASINIQEYEDSHYGPLMKNLLNSMKGENSPESSLQLSGEVSDGASYGHPRFLVDFYKRTYGLSEREEQLHTELMNEKTIPTKEHFDFLKKLGGSNQAGKLQAFSLIKKEDGSMVPFFWKSSILPLYPSLTKGFPIDNLRRVMEKQGVDVVGNTSAFKSLAHTSTELFNPNTEDNKLGQMKSEEEIFLNPFEIETEDIKIQVELSAKGDKEMLAGSQNLRNVTANMDFSSPDENYFHDGKAVTALEMHNIYDSDIKNLIQFQLNEFLERIDYKGGGFFDKSVFRKMISTQLGDLDFDIKAIIEDVTMPLETIPGMSNRVFPIISSFIQKQVAKPKTNGTGAIQAANTGFNFEERSFADLSEEQQTNSIIFGNSMELKPPRPTGYEDYSKRLNDEQIEHLDAMIEMFNEGKKEDKKFDKKTSPIYFNSKNTSLISLSKEDGYFGQIEDGEIMIPFSSIFKKSKMSWEEFKKFATTKDEYGDIIGFDQEILNNIVGYRIPNQSMSSNDSFKVVGILHPSVGDSAIMYHEITSKTGSDFDIDKMILMLPNFLVNMDIMSESNLSFENLKVITDTVKDNEIFSLMNTGKYFSNDYVYEMLFRNERLLNLAEENDFDNKSAQEQVDFFVKNRDQIEYFLEKDNRKALTYRRNDHTIKDVLKDFYTAQETQESAIDKALKEEGFQPRQRYVMSSVEYINDNSEKGLQNKLIRSMRSILKSSATFDDLISPLDGTHIKDSISKIKYFYYLAENNPEGIKAYESSSEEKKKKILNEFIGSQKKSLAASMMPNYLAKSRTDMLMAKGLTATMANHMTNIPLTQAQNVFLKYNIGLGTSSLARTHVIGKEHLDEFKITKMVSYLMNASVDAAKDNYIIEGNYNSYSSGAAMFLIRLGIDPEEVSKIIMHPLIAKLSKEKLGSTSKIADIRAEYTNDELEQMSYRLAVKINEGFEIKPDDFLQNIIDKGLDEKEKSGLSDEDILGFWNMAVTFGKELNDAIKLSKPDSNGFGKTSSEAHVLSNMHDLAESNALATKDREGNLIGGGMVFNKATSGIHPFSSDVSTQYDENTQEYVSGLEGNYNAAISNVAISLTDALTKSELIERTPGFIKLVNDIANNIGLGHTFNEDKIKLLSATLYPYVLHTSGHPLYQFMPESETQISDMEDLLKNLPKDILKMKSSEDMIDNKFLKEVSVDEAKGFISFNNTANYSDLTKISIKDSSNTLYSNPEYRSIMERMIKYCFFTTGFKPSSYSFVNYLSKQYFVDSKHDVAISNLLLNLSDEESYTQSHLEKAMLFLAANRPEDEVIYKKITSKNARIESGKAIQGESMIKKVKFTHPDTKEEKFYPFVSIDKKDSVLNFGLVEIIPGNPKLKTTDRPVYQLLKVMQYSSKKDFSGKKSNSDGKSGIKTNYNDIAEDSDSNQESSAVEFGSDNNQRVTKKARGSRLILFNPSMSSRTEVFKGEGEYSLIYENNRQNVVVKNNRKMFNLDPSKEAIEPYKAKVKPVKEDYEKYLDLNEVENNKELAEILKKEVANNSLFSLEQAEDIKKMINAFHKSDKNNHYKQKAVLALQQLTGCKI